jgi:membrane-associated phospholipid phosphatase
MSDGNDRFSWLRRGWEWIKHSKLASLVTTLPVFGLSFAAFTLWGFGYLASEVFENETQVFDTKVLHALRQTHTHNLDVLMTGITFLGESRFLIVVSIGIGIYLLWKRQIAEALTLFIAAIGASGLNYVLKIVFARARPELWERIIDEKFYSFPSGHATLSLVIYGLIAYLLITYLSRGWRVYVISLTALLILAIGFSRLYLGVHWPTDVMAGYASGSVWLIACILTLRKYHALMHETI